MLKKGTTEIHVGLVNAWYPQVRKYISSNYADYIDWRYEDFQRIFGRDFELTWEIVHVSQPCAHFVVELFYKDECHTFDADYRMNNEHEARKEALMLASIWVTDILEKSGSITRLKKYLNSHQVEL